METPLIFPETNRLFETRCCWAATKQALAAAAEYDCDMSNDPQSHSARGLGI